MCRALDPINTMGDNFLQKLCDRLVHSKDNESQDQLVKRVLHEAYIDSRAVGSQVFPK